MVDKRSCSNKHVDSKPDQSSNAENEEGLTIGLLYFDAFETMWL